VGSGAVAAASAVGAGAASAKAKVKHKMGKKKGGELWSPLVSIDADFLAEGMMSELDIAALKHIIDIARPSMELEKLFELLNQHVNYNEQGVAQPIGFQPGDLGFDNELAELALEFVDTLITNHTGNEAETRKMLSIHQ